LTVTIALTVTTNKSPGSTGMAGAELHRRLALFLSLLPTFDPIHAFTGDKQALPCQRFVFQTVHLFLSGGRGIRVFSVCLLQDGD